MHGFTRATGFAALAAGLLGSCVLVAPLDDTFGSAKSEAGASVGAQAGSATSGGTSSGGTSSGAGGEIDETGGTGGTGGTSLNAPCSTNAECVERSGTDAPYRCNEEQRCIPLRNSECPFVYDTEAVKADNPIYIGAFAPMPLVSPEESTVLFPFRLALEEINGAFGGLVMPNGERRPLVMVACNNCAGNTCDTESIDAAAQHLIDDVGVKGVLATLLPDDLRRVFENSPKDVFFLSPVGATSALTSSLDDDDLVWTMLGQPSDLSVVYRDLVTNLVEPYLRDVRGIGSRPIRVALLRGTDAFGLELSARVAEELVWNGLSATENGDDYKGFTLNGSRPLDELVDELIGFAPDLVISTAGGEVTRGQSGIIWQLETKWSGFVADVPLPFWVLSPYNAGDLADVVELLETEMTGADSEPTKRFVGITAASDAEGDLQTLYAINVRDAFLGADTDTGNYYDAFYFLTYATYAARVDDPVGTDLARGMRRLISGDPYDVGIADIGSILDVLGDDSSTIALQGTLGPPDFDPNGIRVDPGAVFCFQASGSSVLVQPNALRYDRGAGTFSGNFPCFSDFQPP